jgi:hypothetical protein
MTPQRTIHRKRAKAIVIRAWAMHEIRISDENLIAKEQMKGGGGGRMRLRPRAQESQVNVTTQQKRRKNND